MRAVIGDCRSWSCEAVTIERLSDYQPERVECEEVEKKKQRRSREHAEAIREDLQAWAKSSDTMLTCICYYKCRETDWEKRENENSRYILCFLLFKYTFPAVVS
jgi:hypothetical protein